MSHELGRLQFALAHDFQHIGVVTVPTGFEVGNWASYTFFISMFQSLVFSNL
jgi:hypothetical protein